MSSSHSDNQHSEEQKPIAFTVPLILASVLIFIIVLFLSLCDPKKHGHEAEHAGHSEAVMHDVNAAAKETGHEEVAEVQEVVREAIMVKLINGKELEAYKGGIEDKLVNFINDASAKPEKTIWFDFDNLLFETGKATLTAESQKQLNNITEILAAYPKVKIKIGGYTDNVGDSLANVKLSQQRAENVLAELKSKKVAAEQLVSAEGYGPMHAVADNASEDGRAKNRRISINVREK
jgi:outer membrane protein OmpA-like peptidoglycan-associated protein